MTSQIDIHRWIFDIRISNVHLTTSQMDIQYSNIKRPSDDPHRNQNVASRWFYYNFKFIIYNL